MTRNCFVLAVVLGVMFSAFDDSSQVDAQGFFTPRSLRSVPIVDRPDRPGHFIGNSIRRRYNQPPAVQSPRQRYRAPLNAPSAGWYSPPVPQSVVVNRPVINQPSYVQAPPTYSYPQTVVRQQVVPQVPQSRQSRPITQSSYPAYYTPLGGSVLSN